MKYPSFLKENQTIGFIATSMGCNHDPYRTRVKEGINYLSQKYKIKRGHRIYRNNLLISSSYESIAKEFNLMYKNKNINFINAVAGGELMMGILPYIDFDKIKKLPPKYFMGFSDNTNLTYTLTTICDVATIYGMGPGNYARIPHSVDTIDNLKIMTGEKLKFESYPYFAGINSKQENANILDPQLYNDENIIKSLHHEKVSFQGRMIGGCLDVLVCLCGTKFDNTLNFIEKYKDDGIIFYFDPCDLNSCGMFRALLQLEQAGWFKYIKGFFIGRNANFDEPFNYSHEMAIKEVLDKYDVPILYQTDISHIHPTLPVINGAIAKIDYDNGKYQIEYILK